MTVFVSCYKDKSKWASSINCKHSDNLDTAVTFSYSTKGIEAFQKSRIFLKHKDGASQQE